MPANQEAIALDSPHERDFKMNHTPCPEGPSAGSTAVVMMPIEKLKRGSVLRILGEDHSHARLLAGTPKPLPPILVHRSRMTVIDGMHRLLAARLRGEKAIAVRFFDGNDQEAFIAAIRANIEHGKPLSLADREQAAEKIIAMHPEWSDRVIGEICALSPKTVASRRRATTDSPGLHTRTGRDGRTRPLDPNPGRERIVAEVTKNPGASLRQIADQTGTSTGTVRDVRRRLAGGESPFPNDTRRTRDLSSLDSDVAGARSWAEDVACASTEEGSQFALWFDATNVRPQDCDRYAEMPPLSRLYDIITEAKARSGAWAQFAAALEHRARRDGSTPQSRASIVIED